VGTTLNNLGALYRSAGRADEAEKVFAEALAIRRDLVSRDPGAYRPNVAATLDNLGALYVSTGRLGEAEKADTEALAIRRDLAAHDPGAYRPSLAISLNSLGIVYKRTGRTNDAEKAYNAARIWGSSISTCTGKRMRASCWEKLSIFTVIWRPPTSRYMLPVSSP
jgi:tetratricopeptide (TPR) repeat protein